MRQNEGSKDEEKEENERDGDYDRIVKMRKTSMRERGE